MEIKLLHQLFLDSKGICTDTRKLSSGQLFFALKGVNFDGNIYAEQALSHGATHAIVDDAKYVKDHTYILVKDVLLTLQSLATFHREFLKLPIIALTGSNGKTTTKELLYTVLAKKYNVTATKGNLNNHIGVPLTLLDMNSQTEIGIVEMGANHVGEINFLCTIALPDYGYITNIGKAHLEGFGSIEGVLQGKTELYRHLQKRNKLIFINRDDPKLSSQAGTENIYSFGNNEHTSIRSKTERADPFVSVSCNNKQYTSQLIGLYNATNIIAAISIGIYFEVTEEAIKEAISSYQPENNRSQLIKRGSNTIILDAYNANPTSMVAAIKNFAQLKNNHKAAFLGDMFEVGKDSLKEHQTIVDLLADSSIETIYLFGAHFFKTNIPDRFKKFKTVDEFIGQNLKLSLLSNGIVLIKGSRGMEMERVVTLI